MAIGRVMFVGVSAGHHCTMGYYWHQPSPCHSAGILDKKIARKDRSSTRTLLPSWRKPSRNVAVTQGPGALEGKSELGGEPRDIWKCKKITKMCCGAIILVPENAAKDALAERSKAVAQGAIP